MVSMVQKQKEKRTYREWETKERPMTYREYLFRKLAGHALNFAKETGRRAYLNKEYIAPGAFREHREGRSRKERRHRRY